MTSKFIKDESSNFDEGILLEEYKGAFALVNAQEGQDGKIFKRWIFPQGKERKPLEKAIPWQIRLGDKETAIRKLKALLAMIEDDQSPPPYPTNDGEIPF